MNMFHSFCVGLFGVLIFGSLNGQVSSEPLYSTLSPHMSNGSTSTRLKGPDNFVPDILPAEDDDAEEQPAERSVQRKIKTVSKAIPSQATSGSTRPSYSQYSKVKNVVRGHRRLLKDTGGALDITTMTSTSRKDDPQPQVANPQGKLHLHPSRLLNSRSLTSTNTANKVSIEEQHGQTSPTNDEEKLTTATRKLVKWLRNRLRKRLEDVARLEEKYDIEKNLLTRLNETIEVETSERQAEIKMKLKTQNELKDVRRHFSEPDRELGEVRTENSHLVNQLSRLKRLYDDLAVTRKHMEDKLVAAGFTHWLDKRGKEYMPATAVGVLSKSARILDPVSRGLEEVVKLDKLFSTGVESVIPISQRSLVSKILRDLALLLPVIPIVMLLWRMSQLSQHISIIHLVMYISTIFAIQSSLLFGFSLCIGTEVIGEIHESYELLVVTGVFFDVLLFFVMIVVQILVMLLHTSKSEIMQSLLSLAVGCHFFRDVFRPVVVGQPPTATIPAHAMYAINFAIIAFEKKTTLQVGTRFDKHLNAFLLSLEGWCCETFQAMKDLFEDALPDMSDGDTTSTDVHTLTSHNALLRELDPIEENASKRREPDVEEVAKALNASRGYARWTVGKTGDGNSQVKPSFRGIRWHQGNPQLTLLQSGSRRRARQENVPSEAALPEFFHTPKK